MHLVILGDTHIPGRARELAPELWTALSDADAVLHTGDWTEVGLLDQLAPRCNRLVAVFGNNDDAELRARLPEVARVELAGVRFVVVHETGPASGREKRCKARFPDADVVVFGHSHVPWDSTASGDLRLLNPGSPTDRRRQPACTFMEAEVADGLLVGVQLRQVSPERRPRH
ncbi:MAG: YfcE family phosphodiesterase [Acidimicrobiales bacterium]|nr:MAG: YfcE family phosphodiesterase [Acidimicrobiales bacterium]